MAVIEFYNINQKDKDKLKQLFDCIAKAKVDNAIDPDKIVEILQQRHQDKFWWPTEQEQQAWVEKWIVADEHARENDAALQRPWDFDSWIAALDHIDVLLESVQVNDDGTGHFNYQPLDHFCEDVKSIEQIVKVFDGKIKPC